MELTSNLHAFLWESPSVNNCNTYLIKTPGKNILIDPGHASCFDHVSSGLQQLGLSSKDIDLVICTHAHADHIDAVRLFNGEKALFTMHEIEWKVIREEVSYISASMDVDLARFNPDFFLKEGELKVGEVVLDVFHTPGHTPGSVTLYWQDARALFTGDLVFQDGLGRTDLPGGNGSQLKDSIRRIATLNSEWLLSGHGGVLTGTDMVETNFKQVEQKWFRYV